MYRPNTQRELEQAKLVGKLAGFEEAINILSKAAGDEDFIHASIVVALQNQIDALREMVD